MDFKTYVLSVPRLDWRFIYGKRARVLFGAVVGSFFVLYWWVALFPYVWISNGHVEMFTWSSASAEGKRVVFLGPDVGDRVKKGDALYAIDSNASAERLAWLRGKIPSLEERVVFEKKRMEQAMQAYFSSLQQELAASSCLAALEEAQSASERAAKALEGAQAEIISLEAEMKESTLFAPFDGVVVSRTKGEGQALICLVDPRKVWVRCRIPETRIESVAVGAAVRVQLAAYPKKWWQGVVAKIDPAVCEGTVGVEVALADADFSLKPGFSAAVRLKVR